MEMTGYVKVKNPKQPGEFLWLHQRDFKPPWERWTEPAPAPAEVPPASTPVPAEAPTPEPEVRLPRPRPQRGNRLEAYDTPVK